jgi:hypothetical protein
MALELSIIWARFAVLPVRGEKASLPSRRSCSVIGTIDAIVLLIVAANGPLLGCLWAARSSSNCDISEKIVSSVNCPERYAYPATRRASSTSWRSNAFIDEGENSLESIVMVVAPVSLEVLCDVQVIAVLNRGCLLSSRRGSGTRMEIRMAQLEAPNTKIGA